ncbi:anaphase-promoting complex subunit 5 [Methanothermobacter defluvii]|uniref:Anaphase-promoting complex subunit 5 n=1 Tax=Methanothermobacter defluvii TaxID=49339 RepID=A0A371NE74_9EURY|nr:tetratricopeptide repeat protein [Methanothermobacter defluvii]REE28764.1 anaphase-promoting complex subunit 5 [Methanothermobacter defluvii]
MMIFAVLGIFDFLRGEDEGESLEKYLRKLEDLLEEEFDTLVRIAGFYAEEGDTREALDYLERAYRVASEMNDEELMAFALDSMGDVYLSDRKVKTAMEYFMEALRIYTSVNSPLRADLREKIKEVEKIREAMDIASINRLQEESESGMPEVDLEVIEPLLNRLVDSVQSLTLYESGSYEDSISQIREAYQIARDIGDTSTEASLQLVLGLYSLKNEDFDESRRYLKKAEALFRKTNNELGLAVTLVLLGTLDFIGNNADGVASSFRAAVEILQKLDEKELESVTLELLNTLYSF